MNQSLKFVQREYEEDASNNSYKFGNRIKCRVHYPRDLKISRSACSFEDIWPIDRIAGESHPTSKGHSQSDEMSINQHLQRTQKLELLLC